MASSRHAIRAAVLVGTLLGSTSAHAETAHAETVPAEDARIRFGVDGGAGAIAGRQTTLGAFSVDLRFGAQLNDLVALYAEPQFGFYAGSAGSADGFGGLLGASGLVDFTLDHFFIAAGGGYAVLTSVSGPELHLRFGGYPILHRDPATARRRALMLGVDLRAHLLDAGTFYAPTFCIGYEMF